MQRVTYGYILFHTKCNAPPHHETVGVKDFLRRSLCSAAGRFVFMEHLTSRKNPVIRHLRELSMDRACRRESGEFVCDGEKLLGEARRAGAEITAILCQADRPGDAPAGAAVYTAPRELLAYASPLENSAGPVFSVRVRPLPESAPGRVLLLENVQDPGNIGTVLRTAAAFGIGLVALVDGCADPYNPKTVRASMGAIFRQAFCELSREELPARLRAWGLPLYGAALDAKARDIRALPLSRCAVAVGNEGRGLTPELLALCDEKLIIPMTPESESLNAAVAASIIMWEMTRG